MSVNLLQDRETTENNGKKKKTSQGLELTDPKSEKDETKKKIKKGGVMEFIKGVFKKPPKIKIQSEEEIIKEPPEIKRKKRPRRKKPKLEPARSEEMPQISPKETLARKVQEKPVSPKVMASVKPSSQAFSKEPAAPKESPPQIPQKPLPKKETPPKPVAKPAPASLERKKKETTVETTAGALAADQEQLPDVNLIPEEIRIKLEPKRKLKTLVVAVVICLAVILLFWGGMIWQQSRIQKDIEGVIAEAEMVQSEIASFESVRKTGEQLNSKISLVEQTLDSHIYWTNFLAELENHTLPEVYYKNLACDTAGKVNLSATTTDLQSLAKQYTIFQNAEEFVDSVEISAVTMGREGEVSGVTFNISLSVYPSIFYNRILTERNGS